MSSNDTLRVPLRLAILLEAEEVKIVIAGGKSGAARVGSGTLCLMSGS